MSLDVWGLIERWTGNCNIASVKDKGFWSLHTYMRYVICDDAMMQLRYRIGGFHLGKTNRGWSTLQFAIAISHRRRSNGHGEGS